MAVLFYADHKGVVQVVAAGILPDSECIRAMEHQQYVGKIIDRAVFFRIECGIRCL